jgi:hypothetical protein
VRATATTTTTTMIMITTTILGGPLSLADIALLQTPAGLLRQDLTVFIARMKRPDRLVRLPDGLCFRFFAPSGVVVETSSPLPPRSDRFDNNKKQAATS